MYEVLESLLKKHKVSIYKLAKDTGLQPSMFSRWKAGDYTPKLDKLQRIADYFSVSVDYLTTGKETYYISDDVTEIAQAVFNRPELKVLFDACKKASKEDVQQAISMLDYLYKKEKHDE